MVDQSYLPGDYESNTAIADSGGLTRAARRLHLTQSALSHQLRDIESRLGVPLFLRANRRLVLTPAGERLLVSARRVLHEHESAERELTSGEFFAGAGVVRVATECYTCYHWLPSVLTSFRADWPRVEIRIVPEVTANPVGALLDGALDIAIVAREVEDRRLRSTPLFEDEMVVVMHPGNRLASRAFVSPQELAAEHLILYSTPHSESSVLREVLRPAGYEPARLTRVQLTEAILELVRADLGVTVLARWAVAPQLREGTLSALPLTQRGFTRCWRAVMRSGDGSPAYLRSLLDLLARQLHGGPVVRTEPRRA